MMDKFYAVTTRDFGECHHIVTIYTDRDKAERMASWLNKVNKRGEEADVEEYDSVAVPGETDLPYCVKFRTDGSISWTEKCDAEFALMGVMFKGGDGLLRVYVLAPDEESAEEKAAKSLQKHFSEGR